MLDPFGVAVEPFAGEEIVTTGARLSARTERCSIVWFEGFALSET